MLSISVKELRQKLSGENDVLLVDVREKAEHELFNIGGELIPFTSPIIDFIKIARDRPVIFYCQKGIRSQIIIQRLHQKFNYTNLVNLAGGMNEWNRGSEKENELSI